MTFAERIQDVISLGPGSGFTDQQAKFIVTVALHSGYCLRRQYSAFTGRQYGQNVCDFLDGPVTDRKSTRLNSSHRTVSRMPSSA